MKFHPITRYAWRTDDGFTVAKFHIGADSVLGVTPPDGRKPAFYGQRDEVLGWIETYRQNLQKHQSL